MELTETQRAFKNRIREFAEKEIAPLVDSCEEAMAFPVELFPKLGRLGYLGIGFPSEYGGIASDKITLCIYVEELCRVCAGISAGLMLNSAMGTRPIFEYGTEEQKQRYLLPALKGEKISAFAVTESKAGCDASSIQTTAEEHNGYYVIHGSKTMITNATIGDYVIVSARTDGGKGRERTKEIGLFILDKETKGLQTKKLRKMGLWSADMGDVILTGCRVSRGNVIGGEKEGLEIMRSCLNGVRILTGSRYVGIAEAAFEAALTYSKERVQFDRPISTFQAIRFKLADMAMEIEASRLLVHQAASLWDQGRHVTKYASMAKLHASEMAVKVTGEALQVYGGYGYLMDYPLQRFFRDARVGTLHEGTSEIQRLIIAREIGL